MTATLDAETLLAKLPPTCEFDGALRVHVAGSGRPAEPAEAPDETGLLVRGERIVNGDRWILEARPSEAWLSRERSKVPLALLFGGLAPAILLPLVLVLAHKARRQAATLFLREGELSKRAAELERSNKELDDFAYVASHDLREPLRGIHSYSTFLVEDYGSRLDDEGRRMLQTLPRLTQRMESLIESLLRYSRAGRTETSIEPVDLGEILGETLDSLRPLLQERSVEVRVPAPLPVLACDRSSVGEVFQNLIANAVHYNANEEKWIEIGVRGSPPEEAGSRGPTVYVRDNGIGIPEKHLDSIFRIFKRLHAQDRHGGGSGAGLTITRKIVERHGGRVWVESDLGQGSTFCFTLAP